MAPNFNENIFVNVGNALHITKILVAKILVLYRCSPATQLAIRIIQGSVIVLKSFHCHQLGNFDSWM